MASISFLGASRNVTGSRFMLRTKESNVLIDCGLFQERDLRFRNWEDFPFPPKEIDVVVLTHAHIDHCGYLPKLVREGFSGKILCTTPTVEVARVALLDSAKIHEEDAAYKKRRHKKENRKGPFPEIPLYTVKDAEAVLPLLDPVPYHKPRNLTPDAEVTFYDAGHIIGSSCLELRIREGVEEKKLIFSGDLGRLNNPLLSDPERFEEADYIFVESTYGNRLHESGQDAIETLKRVISETAQSGGNIVIPTFAIERTQELIYFLKRLIGEGQIPRLTCFIDSPMAANITKIYSSFPKYLDQETINEEGMDGSPFSFPSLVITKTSEESKEINEYQGSAVIMAGSGMCTGGRIKHHLVHNIGRPESTLLFVGYQARGTLGRILLGKPREVRILGKIHPVRARIEQINGFSAHADRDELIEWLSSFKSSPRKVFVIHGEEESSLALAETIRSKWGWETVIPDYMATETL